MHASISAASLCIETWCRADRDLLQEDGPDSTKAEEALSKHERQQRRMQERIAKLEAQNMAEKDWFMQGESGAGLCLGLVPAQHKHTAEKPSYVSQAM